MYRYTILHDNHKPSVCTRTPWRSTRDKADQDIRTAAGALILDSIRDSASTLRRPDTGEDVGIAMLNSLPDQIAFASKADALEQRSNLGECAR